MTVSTLPLSRSTARLPCPLPANLQILQNGTGYCIPRTSCSPVSAGPDLESILIRSTRRHDEEGKIWRRVAQLCNPTQWDGFHSTLREFPEQTIMKAWHCFLYSGSRLPGRKDGGPFFVRDPVDVFPVARFLGNGNP